VTVRESSVPLVKSLCKKCWEELNAKDQLIGDLPWWDSGDERSWERLGVVICRVLFDKNSSESSLPIDGTPPKECLRLFEYAVAAGRSRDD
jgi:hypothetical protein